MIEPIEVSIKTFKILADEHGDTHVVASQENLVGKFPCLLTLLHTNLECYLFRKSLHILCVRDQFVKGRISLLKQCVIFF